MKYLTLVAVWSTEWFFTMGWIAKALTTTAVSSSTPATVSSTRSRIPLCCFLASELSQPDSSLSCSKSSVRAMVFVCFVTLAEIFLHKGLVSCPRSSPSHYGCVRHGEIAVRLCDSFDFVELVPRVNAVGTLQPEQSFENGFRAGANPRLIFLESRLVSGGAQLCLCRRAWIDRFSARENSSKFTFDSVRANRLDRQKVFHSFDGFVVSFESFPCCEPSEMFGHAPSPAVCSSDFACTDEVLESVWFSH